jgi:hypothetical protein
MADQDAIKKSIDAFRQQVTEVALQYMEKRGLTAVPPKHVWLDDPEKGTCSVREGFAPDNETRPEHLKNLDLNVLNFRVKGTVWRKK